MKIAIMQPYFFPYIGYFQLIQAADKFIFYDDVNFITKGWINRNRVIISRKVNYITVPLSDASQNKLIKDVYLANDSTKIKKMLASLRQSYSKAPFFADVFPLVETLLQKTSDKIPVSELAIESVTKVCDYLGINKPFEKSSSNKYSETKGYSKADRLIQICKINNATEYINPIGGTELYQKEYFDAQGVKLFFLKSKEIKYRQFGEEFFPNLSIIDVLMFNSPAQVNDFLNCYELI